MIWIGWIALIVVLFNLIFFGILGVIYFIEDYKYFRKTRGKHRNKRS